MRSDGLRSALVTSVDPGAVSGAARAFLTRTEGSMEDGQLMFVRAPGFLVYPKW